MVKDQVVSALADMVKAYPTYKIIFTGHSMGGAVATYAVADFRKNLGYDIDLYTFASPRVGNQEFVEYVSNQPGTHYRVTHLDDIVPRVPPIFLNYRHTSPEYWIDMGIANTTDIVASGVEYCEGYSNVACNGGTTGLDITAHNYYFLWIDGCGPSGISLKRDEVEGRSDNMSDAALEAMLNGYVAMDKVYTKFTLGSNVWA
jgi:pimeloyl-ACP methyl ester carboxylesterase